MAFKLRLKKPNQIRIIYDWNADSSNTLSWNRFASPAMLDAEELVIDSFTSALVNGMTETGSKILDNGRSVKNTSATWHKRYLSWQDEFEELAVWPRRGRNVQPCEQGGQDDDEGAKRKGWYREKWQETAVKRHITPQGSRIMQQIWANRRAKVSLKKRTLLIALILTITKQTY